MKRPLKTISILILAAGALLVLLPAATAQEHSQGQGNCVPLSGTVYLWLTDTWHGVGDFTIGRKHLPASFLAVNTSFLDSGDVWEGTEDWTLDFGNGNKLHVAAHFVTQHMTDSVSTAGAFDLVDGGRFLQGTRMFKNAYGNMTVQGPFGPGVKLPDNIHPPADAQWFSVVESQGMICGMNDGD